MTESLINHNENQQFAAGMVEYPTPSSSPVPLDCSHNSRSAAPDSDIKHSLIVEDSQQGKLNSFLSLNIGAENEIVRHAEAACDPLVKPLISASSISPSPASRTQSLITPNASPLHPIAEEVGEHLHGDEMTAQAQSKQDTSPRNELNHYSNADETDLALSSALMSFAKSSIASSGSSRIDIDGDKELSPISEGSATSPSTPASPSTKTCFSCGTKSTPLWRRSGDGNTVCNACGLYLKSNKTERPAWLKKRLEEARFTIGPDGTLIGNSKCVNCGVTSTPLWRRDGEGNLNCNACGLYYKLHNTARPLDIVNRKPVQKKDQIPPKKATHSDTIASSSNSASIAEQHQMEILRMRKRRREQEHQTTQAHQYQQQLQYNRPRSIVGDQQMPHADFNSSSYAYHQEHHLKRYKGGNYMGDFVNRSYRQPSHKLQLPPLVPKLSNTHLYQQQLYQHLGVEREIITKDRKQGHSSAQKKLPSLHSFLHAHGFRRST